MIKCKSCTDSKRPGIRPMVPKLAQCGHMASTGGYMYCESCAKDKDCCTVCGLSLNLVNKSQTKE